MDWDNYFMSMAYLVAMKSKDQSTHVGAVIVGPNNEIRSTGYNSFVRGINDNVPERHERPEKYFWMEHSERNAIFNAARVGTSTEGCIMYTPGIPCADCCRGIIQSGIKEVVVHNKWDMNNPGHEKWAKAAERSSIMFEEASVKLRVYRGKITTELFALINATKIDLN